MKKTIGIIGFGNMGSAIARQIKSKYIVLIFDKDCKKTKKLSGIKLAKTAEELAEKSEVIILAVKPQDFESVLSEIKTCAKGKLIISIAAGITTKYIEKKLGKVKVIRVMPNLGAKIGESVTCLCKGKFAKRNDIPFAKKLFSYIGSTTILSENKMDVVTAISGSGPAYVCHSIEAGLEIDDFLARFKKAAKPISDEVGLSYKDMSFLVNSTTTSTINLIKKTKVEPSELRKQVTSRGGTTAAALKVLKRSWSAFGDALKAAARRAKQLSRG